MDIYGDLVSAGLEKLAAHPTNTFLGRVYFNTASSEMYFYNGTTWETVTSLKHKMDNAVDPTVDNDIDEGYEAGSMWYNTVREVMFVCLSNADGAAVWKPNEDVKNNYTATTDPTETNDSSEGYEIGSKWVNTADAKIFFCVKPDVGGAEWSSGGGSGAGDTSVYSLLDNDSTKVSKWTTTGLTSGATFVDNTTNQLSGKSDYLYSTDTNNADNCYINISVPVRSRADQSSMHKISFPYIQTGTEDTIQIELYDVTNSASIKTIDLLNKNNRFTGSFTMPVGCEEIRVIIGSITDDFGELEIDQITLSDKFGEYGSVTVSETIAMTGLLSMVGRFFQLRNELTNTSDELLSLSQVNGTRYTAIKGCTFVASANSYQGGTGQACELILYDKTGAQKNKSYNQATDQTYGKPLALNGIMEEGDYLQVSNINSNPQDSIFTNFSVTATAQSDTVQFEDSYQQGHVVASLKLEGNGGESITANTENIPFAGTSEFWTSGTGLTDNYYTVQKDDAEISIDTHIRTTVGVSAQRLKVFVDTGSGFLEYKAISDGEADTVNIQKGTYTSKKGEFSKGDKIGVRLKGDATLVNDTINHYLNITETYLPPVEQASTTRMLAVKSSLENDFDVDASSAGVLSNFNGASDWVSLVSKGALGAFNYTLNTDIYTGFPLILSDVVTSNGRTSTVTLGVFPFFSIGTRNADGSTADVPHTITAKKRGADRSSRHTPVVNGDDVVKEKVMRLEQNTQTIASVDGGEIVLPIDNLGGELFGSLSNDIVTVSKGTYCADLFLGCYQTGEAYIRLYKNGSMLKEGCVAYADHAATVQAVSTISGFTFSCEQGDEIELRAYSGYADAYAYGDSGYRQSRSSFSIRKIL